jgi:para-aminobenzoate synthetase component 2
VQYLAQLGAECTVLRNDEVTVTDAQNYDGVLVSPGPGIPEAAGVSIELVKFCAENKIPLLGVCLGHQAIGVAFGGVVSRAPELLHGKTSQVHHNDKGVLHGLRDGFTATRYHSLAIERDSISSENSELEITGWTESGVVMAVCHKSLPIHGVQFHPESVLTEGGHHLLANWLMICGDKSALDKSEGLAPVIGK